MIDRVLSGLMRRAATMDFIQGSMARLCLLGMGIALLLNCMGWAEDECDIVDKDCDTGFIAHQCRCVLACESHAECREKGLCVGDLDGRPEKTCESEHCITDADCTIGQCAWGRNQCEMIPSFHRLRIADITCFRDDEASGTKLMYVRLYDRGNGLLAYGRAVSANIPPGPFDDWEGVLDGTQRFEGPCPERENAFPQDLLALGCEGYVDIEFFDDDGKPIVLREGYRAVVGAYTTSCHGEELPDDLFDIYLCANEPDVDAPDRCDARRLSEGTGITSVNISMPPAR